MKFTEKNSNIIEYSPPPDKSITHRALIISAISHSIVEIENALFSEDTHATADCLRNLGVDIIEIESEKKFIVKGVGLRGLRKSEKPLDCKNSATTMRLLSGVLAGEDFESYLTGDDSLLKRPMERLCEPLRAMGANIELNDGKAPIKIFPVKKLRAVNYELKTPSSQVLSAMELLDLFTGKKSNINYSFNLRNHTEIILDFFKKKNFIVDKYIIPGDFSSSAFFILWAFLNNKNLNIKNTGINPGRTGLLKVLRRMGANFEVKNKRELQGEPVCDLLILPSNLEGTEIFKEEIPSMIDEIPVIAVLSLFTKGKTIIRGLSELRYKETDRLGNLEFSLKSAGADIEIKEDDTLVITGGREIKKTNFNSSGDHRLAMVYEILRRSLWKTEMEEKSVRISYPDFYKDLKEVQLG